MISLRPALPEDFPEIRYLLERAFDRRNEADLVERLRAGGYCCLELVAEAGGRLAGHIFYSPLAVEAPGRDVRAAALAPLAVHPGFQRRGIGGALIHMSIPMLAHSGFDAIFVLGPNDYYTRFGFSPEAAASLRHPFPPGPHFMALELTPGVLDDLPGQVRYAPPFGL